MKIEVIIEKGDGELFGRIEGKGSFMPVTNAGTLDEIFANLKFLIKDYLKHEGKTDTFWKKLNVKELEFEVLYDVQAFFAEHNFLNASAVADKAGISRGLIRQYTSGAKHPSIAQAKKIEAAIKQIANELKAIELYA